jgi:hypothetical protein
MEKLKTNPKMKKGRDYETFLILPLYFYPQRKIVREQINGKVEEVVRESGISEENVATIAYQLTAFCNKFGGAFNKVKRTKELLNLLAPLPESKKIELLEYINSLFDSTNLSGKPLKFYYDINNFLKLIYKIYSRENLRLMDDILVEHVKKTMVEEDFSFYYRVMDDVLEFFASLDEEQHKLRVIAKPILRLFSAKCYNDNQLRKGLLRMLKQDKVKKCLGKYAELGESCVEYVLSLIEAADYPPILFEGKKITKRKQQTLDEILEQLEIIYQDAKTRSDIVFKSYVINSLRKLEEKLEHISNKIDEKMNRLENRV